MPLPLAAHISVLRHAPLTCGLRHACLCACAGLGFDSDEEPGAEAELCYRLVSMGSAGALLPGYMMEDIKFKASQVGPSCVGV